MSGNEVKTEHDKAVEAVRTALIDTAKKHNVSGTDFSEQVLRLAEAYDRVRNEF